MLYVFPFILMISKEFCNVPFILPYRKSKPMHLFKSTIHEVLFDGPKFWALIVLYSLLDWGFVYTGFKTHLIPQAMLYYLKNSKDFNTCCY